MGDEDGDNDAVVSILCIYSLNFEITQMLVSVSDYLLSLVIVLPRKAS